MKSRLACVVVANGLIYLLDHTHFEIFKIAGVPTAVEDTQYPSLVSDYGIHSIYPNPFNPTTTIRYAVPEPGGTIRISIYNVLGQLVKTLFSGEQISGYHVIRWNGTNHNGQLLASGVYYVHMKAGRFSETKKLTLLK